MRLAVLKERRPAETRVAATPETVKKFIALGLTVAVEAGAGLSAGFPDAEYSAAGAEIAPDAAAALQGAAIVLKVRAPLAEGEGTVDELSLIPRGALMLGQLQATPEMAAAYAKAGIDAGAMELLPRITRAQSMDILSSQANLAGYRAVIEGAAAFDELHKAFHRALLAACGSERLLALHDDLYLQAYRYRRVMMRQFTDAAWFMAEHQDLADVVIARRTEEAVRKLTDHLNSTLAVVYEQGTGGAL